MFSGDFDACAPKWGMQRRESGIVNNLQLFGIRNSRSFFPNLASCPALPQYYFQVFVIDFARGIKAFGEQYPNK
jgi:hypothetical protein